jgi:hypothetical protein
MRPSREKWGYHFPVALLMAACAAPDAPDTDWTVQEDVLASGAAHVINTPPSAGIRATWEAREEIRIGSAHILGPDAFGLVRAIAPLDDGGVAVLDGMAEEIRIFDRSGTHRQTFGGQGAGPGELRASQGLLLDHQGFLRVPERGNARMSVFHPDSGFVRSYRLRVYTTRARGPWDAAMDDSGRTVVWSSGPYRGSSWIMLRVYDPEMNQIDSIPYLDTADRPVDTSGTWRFDTPRGPGHVPVPFHPGSYQVVDPTGELWSSVEGNATLKVPRWRPAGDTALVMESLRPPVEVTQADRDSAMAVVRHQLRSLPSMPRLDPGRVPATRPPLYGLSLDDRGRLWVRITPPEEGTSLYDVFDRRGRYTKTVAVPARVDRWIPPVVHGDVLWAVVTDDRDVQHVMRARLEPTDAREGGADGPRDA